MGGCAVYGRSTPSHLDFEKQAQRLENESANTRANDATAEVQSLEQEESAPSGGDTKLETPGQPPTETDGGAIKQEARLVKTTVT